jgi:NADPH:quinone reductase-like Zn-dependent oxidoreductase
MKSIVFEKYGTIKNLRLEDIAKPICRNNEIRIKIHAASVNDWDWGLLRGKPFINRVIFGLFRPKVKSLGLDISGTVDSIGENVSRFKIGDEVFGDISNYRWGGFAEYVCVKENILKHKPNNLTFEEAAAIPQAGVLAIQSFMDKIKLNQNHHILINGAGGGCGTFAIQIAKHLGAKITAVDISSKFDTMISLGANHVIDYTKTDFTENIETYDFILDFAGYHNLQDYKRSLRKKGTYLMVGGSSKLIMKCLFLGSILSLFGSKKFKMLPHKPNKYLNELVKLNAEGKLNILIDRSFSLDKVPQALEYFGSGEAKGKIIVSVVETVHNKT